MCAEPSATEGSARASRPPHLLADQAAVLDTGFQAGQERYGQLPLDRDVFARSVFARAPGRSEANGGAPQDFERLCLADLFLAVACDQDVPGAWQSLLQQLPRLRAHLARRGLSNTEAAELIDDLPGLLCAPPPRGGARTRIGTYDGSGPLLSWLAIIVHRRHCDRLRERRPGEPAAAAGPPDDVAARLDDPLAGLIDDETSATLRAALREVWRQLTPRETLVMDLVHRQGLAQRRVADLLRIGDSRVSRIQAAASAKVRAAIDSSLALTGSTLTVARIRDALAGFLAAGGQVPLPLPTTYQDPHGATRPAQGA